MALLAKLLLPALMVSLLGGCTLFRANTVTQSGDCPSLLERQRSLNSLSGWEAKAKVGSGKVLAFSGRVQWVQRQEQFDIKASGPFGAGATRISGSPRQVSIVTAKESVSSYQPEALLAKRTGIQLPLANIDSWALGLPGPQSRASYELDDCNRISSLVQNGWQIDYANYAQFSGYELPSNTVMTDGRVTLKLALIEWQPERAVWSVNQISSNTGADAAPVGQAEVYRGTLFDRRAALTADREEEPMGCPIPGM